MEAANPFAQVPSTPEPIIAQVRRQLADDDHVGMWVSVGVLDRVADHAVRELWSSRVKTFVPVLALRTAREILREQDLLISMEQLERRLVGVPPAAMLPREERQPRDVLPIAGDVVSIDDRDVLHL